MRQPSPPPRRLSAAICGLLAVALASGATTTAAAATPPVHEATSTNTAPGDTKAVDAERAAAVEAKRTGQRVPVPESTSETDTVTANPDGSFTLKRTVEPVRTNKTGAWRDLDPTLTRGKDGKIRPASTTGDLVLGGAGSTLLASMTNDGRELAFTWPGSLPAPILNGDSATYPNVLPDVDLTVTAGAQGGFTHTLIVKKPEAARNPKLATLKLGMTTGGVTVTEAGDGSLTARAPDGTTAFTAPAPRMWDSRITPKPAGNNLKTAPPATAQEGAAAVPADRLASTDRRPGAHATTVPLEAAVADGALTLTPDAGLLTAPDTVFPVYIDPVWIPVKKNAGAWGFAQEGYPDVPGQTSTYEPGAGYQHYRDSWGRERSYFQVPYNSGDLNGKVVNKVTFSALQVYGALTSCTVADAKPVHLYLTGDNNVGPQTSWKVKPTEKELWGTVQVPSSAPGCGKQPVDFDITSRLAPYQNWSVVTFGVFGDETISVNNNGFKRFSRLPQDTYLTIEYNTRPNPPSNLRMTPVPVNGASSGNDGYIGAVNPTVGGVSLYATLTDPDAPQNLDANFAVREVGNGDPLVHESGFISWGANGHEARADIPPGKLLDGRTYRWTAQTGDGALGSDISTGQTFTIDATPPSVPALTSTDYPIQGTGRTAGDKGTFTLTATDNASGVQTFEYSLNGTIPVGGAARAVYDDIDKTWKIKDLPIQNWGTNHLYAQTVDKAGNRSQQIDYAFYAPSNPNATTTLGDVTGDGRIDLLTTDDTGALRMYGIDTDPTKGGQLAAGAVEGPIEAAGGKKTWTGALTTHRGGNGITYDDLYVHASGQLYLYQSSFSTELDPDSSGLENNNGQYFTRGNRLLPNRPTTCIAPTGACATYSPNWSKVRQIIAPGDANADGYLDLITIEEDGPDIGGGARGLRMWMFNGNATTGAFAKATLLGATGLNNSDLIAPGDTTGDQLPDLWARDRATGQLHQYASKKNADGTVDVTALGNTAARTPIGTGFDGAAYPRLNSDGDLDGDGKADLWGQAADGRLYVALGITPGADGNAFGPMRLIADNQTPWTTCEKFPSAGDANVKLDLCGPILAKYKATGGPTGPLRLPTSGVLDDGGIGKYADFQGSANDGTTNAHINWSPTTGAWFQHGGTRTKWLQSGALNGPLGYPVSDESTVRDGAGTVIGWISRYAGTPTTGAGAITWTGDTGAHVISGETYNRWQATGGPRGTLGFPATDIANTPTKPGTYTHFRTPGAGADNGSIYTSPGNGAHAVYGSIRSRWAALGWEQGYLGFPTSDEYDITGGRRGDFQGGYVRWNSVTGIAVDHHPGDGTSAQRNEYSGDFDGDGRDDVLTVYDYGQATTALFVSPGNADGSFGAPRQAWVSLAGHFDVTRTKYSVGDFDGDGRDDIAALYVWTDGSTSLFKFTAHPGGVFSDPIPGYVTPAGNWDWNRAAIMAGDYNGDGKDDVAMVYAQVPDPANGTTSVHTWVVRSDGAFDTAVPGWQSAPGTWNAASAKYAVGDYNGDGRTDIAALYGWTDTSVTLHTLLAQPDGKLAAPVQSWRAAPGAWDWNKVQLTTGDHNGDHHVELGAMYDLGAGTTEYRVFPTTAAGLFTDPAVAWRSAPGTWATSAAWPLTGDYNGDGRDDLTAMYEWTDGSTTLDALLANTDGTLTRAPQGWRAPPGTW